MPTSSTQMARPASMAALLLSPRGTGGYTHSTPSPRMSAVHPSHMLLRNLRVDFGHRVSKEHDDTIYHVRLHNLASGRQWNVVKTFRDVRTLQDAMARQLKQGHPCHDVCPWLFAHVATTFPRSVSAARPWMHALRWTRKPPPETSHLKMFLSTSHGVFSVPPGHLTCPVLLNAVATVLIEFFYGPVRAHDEVEASCPQTGIPLSPPSVRSTSFHDKGRQGDVECGVCLQSLEEHPRQHEHSDDDDASDSPQRRCGAHQIEQVSVTTLACGHPFHDECIVTHLNATLRCPVCGFVPKL
ncbi:hypothetical protein H310_11791 [Aphanomyces invadans]|uniref:RING-type domain-containing protein n=1 Tax=Aphanomyces invadans TaxID=157072 RepID=A0A024TLH8_9STRA|nr:hypothetical protein H310_11791 [Aphanomyces invadans]ETV94466.1 hypothetical protein H310_11791 [Aphanomyces invadans]|eukprot:XP_008876781.1 hypothetical protein H310_11791 [Aphanomyces invadans]